MGVHPLQVPDRPKALLAVSFGTSHAQSRRDAIEAVEGALAAAFPDRRLRRAFTSGMIIRKLAREGLTIDDVPAALERLAAECVSDLIIQPTLVLRGDEHEKILRLLEPYRDCFASVRLGAPLLDSAEDFRELAAVLTAAAEAYAREGTAVVWMGHGSSHQANEAYDRLAHQLRLTGGSRHFVGTVEAKPDLASVLARLQANPALQKVVLLPLMIVAGEHGIKDMAGDEAGSWRSAFLAAGCEVCCVLKGLGQYPGVRQIFVRHAREAV